MTHLILTNDSYRLEAELEKQVPVGLLLIHGGVSATKYFCEAIHRAEPIFIFKHTGSAADLGTLMSLCIHMPVAMHTYQGVYMLCVACETLEFIERSRKGKELVRKQPFDYNLRANLQSIPNGWLWPFDEGDAEICRLLNILVRLAVTDLYSVLYVY